MLHVYKRASQMKLPKLTRPKWTRALFQTKKQRVRVRVVEKYSETSLILINSARRSRVSNQAWFSLTFGLTSFLLAVHRVHQFIQFSYFTGRKAPRELDAPFQVSARFSIYDRIKLFCFWQIFNELPYLSFFLFFFFPPSPSALCPSYNDETRALNNSRSSCKYGDGKKEYAEYF